MWGVATLVCDAIPTRNSARAKCLTPKKKRAILQKVGGGRRPRAIEPSPDAELRSRIVLPNTPEEPKNALAIHHSPSVRCGLSLTGHSGAPSSAPKNRFRSRAGRGTLLRCFSPAHQRGIRCPRCQAWRVVQQLRMVAVERSLQLGQDSRRAGDSLFGQTAKRFQPLVRFR